MPKTSDFRAFLPDFSPFRGCFEIRFKVRDQEVVGSNPVASTIKTHAKGVYFRSVACVFFYAEMSVLKKTKADGTSAFLLSVINFFRIHIVVRKPVPGYLFPLGPFFTVVAIGVYGNSASGQKFTPYFDICRIHQMNKIVHNYVHAVFMEIAAVSEPEKI